MDPEITKRGPDRQAVDHDVTRGLGEHRLATMRRRPQTDTAVHGGTDVIAFVATLHLARVQRHPDPERQRFPPDTRLKVERAGDRVGSSRERGDEAIALA